MKKLIFFFYGITSLAWAGNIQILAPRIEGSKGVAEGRATQVPAEEVEYSLGEVSGRNATRITAKPVPVNLWILVDSSAICQAQKVDSTINQMVYALKRQTSPESTLTLLTYTSEAIDFVARQKPLAELEDVQVQCERRPFSTSYDKPLAKLLSEEPVNKVPLVVWVFTAGNLDLSKKTASLLVNKNAELNLILYNEFVEKEIRPAVEATSLALKGQSFHFGLLPKTEAGLFLPSVRYEFQFPLKRQWYGRQLLQIVGKSTAPKAPVFAKGEFSLYVPEGWWDGFWKKYGRWIALGLSVLALGYGIYRTIQYYRPRNCGKCKRRLSFRDNVCLFCTGASQGVLIGNFRRRIDGFGLQRKVLDVLPLATAETELGTHKPSPIRFLRRGKRSRFVKVIRETNANGRVFFRMVRAPECPVEISVNGERLTTQRFLASGDVLTIDRQPLTFFYEEKSV